MGITVTISTKVITFTSEQRDRWVNNEREDCPDEYCRRLPGSMGFGEFLVGQHFAQQGYLWIHHDFNVFGGNKRGKWPKAEEVLLGCLGEERFERVRQLYPRFRPLEEPDLLIYKPDFSELRFAESKRLDTRDKLRVGQAKGLALLSLLLGCTVEVFEVVEEGRPHTARPITWEF